MSQRLLAAVEAATMAAQAASQIAQNVRQGSDEQTWWKLLPKPPTFDHASRESEIAGWKEWSWTFEQYIASIDTRRPDGSVGMALVLPALTDCRWWFESLLVHSGVSSATRRKATGADQKKKTSIDTRFSDDIQEMRNDITKAIDPVDFSDSKRQRNSFLYSMLSSLLRQRPLLVVRQVAGSNGLGLTVYWWSKTSP